MHYQNPVYPFYFADPFVWKFEGSYYGVGTGPVRQMTKASDADFHNYKDKGQEVAFPLITSPDLVHWEWVGGALKVPPWASGADFWAPEVAYHDGLFYLYYSVATEGLKHQLRVATSKTPRGPFEDKAALMKNSADCPFAIDPHPFRDSDGRWYLFYAVDFLDAANDHRAGTALVVDELESMTQLAGGSKTVLRARSDWQRFKENRTMYGQVFDWHTLEGPCVRFHDGLYYCFYSGGCYEGAGYGIDYGVAAKVTGPYSDHGNESGARVLQSVPGHVIGPGHHSIVTGPDDKTDFIVYHAWDLGMNARRMCIDPLIWTRDGPRCAGPTWTATSFPPFGSSGGDDTHLFSSKL
jgi:beta-xylosidase